MIHRIAHPSFILLYGPGSLNRIRKKFRDTVASPKLLQMATEEFIMWAFPRYVIPPGQPLDSKRELVFLMPERSADMIKMALHPMDGAIALKKLVGKANLIEPNIGSSLSLSLSLSIYIYIDPHPPTHQPTQLFFICILGSSTIVPCAVQSKPTKFNTEEK